MTRQIAKIATRIAAISGLTLTAAPAFAHHVMGGRMPATFADGFLSGLGHPVIGIDHFAAVVAVGCLAAAHRAGAALAIGFVVAMIGGVALHLGGASLPGAEIWVALSVIALGMVLAMHRNLGVVGAISLFTVVGLLHGYALGESIYGAEQTPLVAYLVGLCIIQSAIALGAMALSRLVVSAVAQVQPVRLIGAGVAGIGIAILFQQIVPSV